MKNIAFLLLSLLLFACKKDDNTTDELIGGDTQTSQMVLSVIDKNETDLLNPDHPNAFNEKDIVIEHIGYKNSETTQYTYDSGRVRIMKQLDGKPYLLVFPSNFKTTSSKATSIIKWNKETTDIIDVEYASSLQVTKIWVNDELIWSNLTASNLPPTVRK